MQARRPLARAGIEANVLAQFFKNALLIGNIVKILLDFQ
jgi:hypothetical protein